MNKVFEKIIEKLKEQKSGLTEWAEDEAFKLATEKAIEIVKQEAEQYTSTEHINCSSDSSTNGWIPCSERLPKYGEVVMCSCTNSGITISCITHKGVKPSKSVRFGQHSVIAWQPLPQPYQPNGE